MKNLVELYCDVDDFCKVFIPQWQKQLLDDGTQKRRRDGRLTTREVMSIVIGFHLTHYRDLKKQLPWVCVCCTQKGVSTFAELRPVSRDYAQSPCANVRLLHITQGQVMLITTVRKNMKAKAISLWDRAMLSKRFIIETINDQLKNISFLEHLRHRSMHGFMLNLTDVERNSMVIA